MGITAGTPLPDITEKTTKAQTAPQYYTDYLSGLSQAGLGAIYTSGVDAAGKPILKPKTGAELVAGLDPLQQAAFAGTPAAAAQYKPALASAMETAAGVAGGISPERIQNLMSPYTTNVVNEMARLQQENLQRSLLPTLKAGFVGTGGLGGERYATALGQMGADVQRNLLGAQAGALEKGYGSALQAAIQEMGEQTKAAQVQQNIAKAQQELGLGEMGALQKAGAARQEYEQARLDAPLRIAKQVSELMSGKTIPLSSAETFTGPRAGAYAPSDLSSILGVMTTLGAIKAGSPGAKLTQSGIDFLKGIFGSTSKTPATGETGATGGNDTTGGTASGIDIGGMTAEDWKALGEIYGFDVSELDSDETEIG
jgi:hypothetical protein